MWLLPCLCHACACPNWAAPGPLAAPATALEPWPAEPNISAVHLTSIDLEFDDFNMSGAFWNPTTRTLWLANNFGRFFALSADASNSFSVATNSSGVSAKCYPAGDFEGICQANLNADRVYGLDENGWIREFDISTFGVLSETQSWDIRAQCPEVSGSEGAEGVTFVPDAWLLRQGFRDADGSLYTSTNGMGGIFLLGHQVGRSIHAFDLNRASGAYGYVGRYVSGHPEPVGLEFDRSCGLLYIWHNTPTNGLAISELGSDVDGTNRVLRQVVDFLGPPTGNLEGFAMVPGSDTNTWCFVADDWNWNSGAVDSDEDGLDNRGEAGAGTDPNDAAPVFRIMHMAPGPADLGLVIRWSSVSNHSYAIGGGETLDVEFAIVFATNLLATPRDNVFNTPAPAGASMYYRVTVESPKRSLPRFELSRV